MGLPWSAEQLAAFLDHVPAGIGVWDDRLRCEFLNRPARIGLGLTDDPYGRPLRDFLPSPMYDTAAARIRRAAAGHAQQFVRTLSDTAGRETYVDMAYLPVRGADGTSRSVVAMGVDASAEVATEVLRRDIAPYLATVREREQVARDLERRLSLHLEGLARDLGDTAAAHPDLREVLEQAATLTDAARTQLHASVHNRGRVGASAQLPAAVERVLADAAGSLGFTPRLALRGPVERIGPLLGDEILAVLQEGLSNVARHAGARQVVTAVSVTRGEVTVTIADDGRGIGDAAPGGGMANLRARAERHGGACTWGSTGSAGTLLDWRVPLPGTGAAPGPGAAGAVDGAVDGAADGGADGATGRPAPEVRPARPQAGADVADPPVHLDARRLLDVLDALPTAVGVWDTDLRARFLNRALLDWMAREDRDDALGRTLAQLLADDVAIGIAPFARGAFEGVPQHFERESVDGRGTPRHIRVAITPLVDADGVIRHVVGQVSDVTERVRMQEALRESVEQMTALEERRRIAEDLHDVVIQHLFAAGLRLDAARAAAGPRAVAVVDHAVAQVDEAIARLRESILRLRTATAPS